MEKVLLTSEARLGAVASTMESAKALAGAQDFLLVSADEQTLGKGTRGRVWQSPKGNVYMTVGINRRHIPQERLALMPVEMGLLLWHEIAGRLPEAARAKLSLKWPNDLLCDGRKAGGILMESHGELMLAGFGINLAYAPPVQDGGTPSARLEEGGLVDGPAPVIDGLYRRIIEAYSGAEPFDAESLLLEWQSKVDWKLRHKLRDRPGTPGVLPLAVNRQGHLLVRHQDGDEEWLVSDYLS